MEAIDVLDSPSLSVLSRMMEKDAPFNFREFSVSTQVSPRTAMKVRDRLAESGLIRVRVEREQGPTDVLEITLTPLGHRIGALAMKMDRELERSLPKKRLASL